ncbi:BACON domain-containing protein [Bacteroidales bacterium OttesenSCG-928-I21]|nr:BACON domain-containing protein [Bacteroidales bacterium OttesenSCG-928-I21]
MKKFFFYFTGIFLVLSLCLVAGCKDDDDDSKDDADDDNPTIVDPDKPVADPSGTVTVNISESSGSKITIQGDGIYCGYIYWAKPDNFYLDYYSSSSSIKSSICNLGAMKGLGNITNIPQTGFTTPQSDNKSVACETGHGYVVKYEGGKLESPVYVRLYVEEAIISTSGGIMGAKVKYQYPFEPTTLTVSKNELTFPQSGGSQTITVTTGASSFDYSYDSWMNVTDKNNVLTITLPENKNIFERTGELIIKANEKKISVLIIQNPISKTSAPYTIGDIYYENGVKGIVYKVSSNGSHGMIVSLGQTQCQWSTQNVITSCSDQDNGMNNMNIIKQLASWEGRYPAFKWCNDLNTGGVTGWYLPAIHELEELYAGFCGLTEYPGRESDASTVYKNARDKFNAALTNNGGVVINADYHYFSSSEYIDRPTYYVSSFHFYRGDTVQESKNSSYCYVRAIRSF